MKTKRIKLGFIPANRGFFSSELAAKMRAETIKALKQAGVDVVVPSAKDTRVGCVESLEEALKVGRIFRDQEVDGIIVSAVNFGDEQAVAIAVKEVRRKVPVLIVGCQEEEVLTPTTERRDSFCGLLSIADALRQINVPYSVPETPICMPQDESFRGTLERFAAVCRVVNGIRGARYGQIGARPDAFWTCRYNEKALQQMDVTVVTLDLSELVAGVQAMKTDAAVRRLIGDMKKRYDCSAAPAEAMEKLAKIELFLTSFAKAKQLDGLAIQCWTSLQQNLGACSCMAMGRLDDKGIPAACESDILGTLSMHALQLASGQSAALADWNNLHNEDPQLVNCWHCGVFPPSWAKGTAQLGPQKIIGATVGMENAMGCFQFVMEEGPVTLCRVTQDAAGRFKVVMAEGAAEDNVASTFGAYGWVRIPGLSRLYRNVLLRHFPHHVGLCRSHVGNVLWEAFGNYLGFDVFTAENTTGGWTPELPFSVG